MLQHNYASMLAVNGVNLYTIQKLLTHENPKMTIRYAHLNNEYLQKSVRSYPKFLIFHSAIYVL